MKLDPAAYVDGLLRGDRVALARAITLIESERASDVDVAQQVLESILPHTGQSLRVAITGVPGAGKSTLIDSLGMHLIEAHNDRVAVLTIDPSSERSGGSILGDKTRMQRLASSDKAFVRPTPSRGHLGGVARHTREAILLCEAAGHRTVIVETVGVGQSETAAHSMTDFFLLVAIPGAGDELQGIKRGIIELLDGMVINKADGGNEAAATRARIEYSRALHLLGGSAFVLTCSAVTGEGVPQLWQAILDATAQRRASGEFDDRRRSQNESWFRELVREGIEARLRSTVKSKLPDVLDALGRGVITPPAAAKKLLADN